VDELMRSARTILVDARTPVNYTMFAPVHAAMRTDARVRFAFIASEEPSRARAIFAAAGPAARIVGPVAAALMRVEAYVTSDFMWTRHLRRPCRIQMFHGVAGKYGFDAPTESMRLWDRLFFVNRRRLRNFIAAGAIDADSAAIRLIGMPKVDCLVDGSLDRRAVLAGLGLDPARPTVLYAPTWSPASSLNTIGEALIARLTALPVNLIVKLHDRSRDLRPQYSGGIDWAARLERLLTDRPARLAQGADICPYLAAADVMIADHSSAAFEYLLLDRPLVRFHLPGLIALANIHQDYVDALSSTSDTVASVDDAVRAVERALADPSARSAARRLVAADLFHEPGTATARCAAALYEAIGLEPRVVGVQGSGLAAPSTAPGRLTSDRGTPASVCQPSA
jgi:CDP-glycerol:poly(glycerophosphate) glycerophosphotransferase